jgi:hypothetical protein
MLKLVSSNETCRLRQLAVPGPDRFAAGQVLESREQSLRVLVISRTEDGQNAMLMPLPNGELYEARIGDMQGWEIPYLRGPRLVEVRRKSSNRIEWSSYLPDFDAALALWRKFDALQLHHFEVHICTQHPDELAILERCGYFRADQARSSCRM